MNAAAGVGLHVERSLSAIGPEWDAVFEAGPELQTGRAWFEASAAAALPAGAEARFVAVTGPDGPIALFPMVAGPGAAWGSLTTPYTCLYQPLFRPGADPGSLRDAAAAFALMCRGWPVTRLEALDPGWPGLPILRAGFRSAGVPAREFTHFANWHASVPDASWEAYLAARPGALRETIRRKMRASERAGDIRIEIERSGAGFGRALAAYEDVYARSWKLAEPFPRFNAALVQALADTGALRIAVMWQSETPIAAQYWTVIGRNATVLKLAHDETLKALSPGTVLTAAAIKHLIEVDRVTDLDFGRGDDAYKQSWTGQRRLRIGMLGLNVRMRPGLQGLIRHDGGRLLRAVRSRFARLRGGHAGE